MMVLRIRDISFTCEAAEHGASGGCSALGKPSLGTADTAPAPHLVPNVFSQLGQDPVEEGQLRDQCLGLLACRKEKGHGQPQDRRSLPGLWAGDCSAPRHQTGRMRQPMALPPPPCSTQDPFPCSTFRALRSTPSRGAPQALGVFGTGCRGFSASVKPQTLPSPPTPGNRGSRAGTYPGWRPARLSLQEERRNITERCHQSPALSPCTVAPGQRVRSAGAPTGVGMPDWERQEHPSVRRAVTSHLRMPQHTACMGDALSASRSPYSAEGTDLRCEWTHLPGKGTRSGPRRGSWTLPGSASSTPRTPEVRRSQPGGLCLSPRVQRRGGLGP